MPDVSATDAARKLSDLLDAVEHRGERFTIHRHGRAIAHIEPVRSGRGARAKDLLRAGIADPAWSGELDELRELVEVEGRS